MDAGLVVGLSVGVAVLVLIFLVFGCKFARKNEKSVHDFSKELLLDNGAVYRHKNGDEIITIHHKKKRRKKSVSFIDKDKLDNESRTEINNREFEPRQRLFTEYIESNDNNGAHHMGSLSRDCEYEERDHQERGGKRKKYDTSSERTKDKDSKSYIKRYQDYQKTRRKSETDVLDDKRAEVHKDRHQGETTEQRLMSRNASVKQKVEEVKRNSKNNLQTGTRIKVNYDTLYTENDFQLNHGIENTANTNTSSGKTVSQKHSSQRNIPSETSERLLARPQERQLPLLPPEPTETSTDSQANKNHASHKTRHGVNRSRHGPESNVIRPIEAVAQDHSSQRNIPSRPSERILARPQQRQLPLSPPEPTEIPTDRPAYENYESHKTRHGVDRSRQEEENYVHRPIEAVAQKYSSQKNIPSRPSERFMARPQERQLPLSPPEPTETPTDMPAFENYESHKIRHGVNRSRQGEERYVHRPIEAVAQKYSSQKNIPSGTRERFMARPQERQLPLSPSEPTETSTDRPAFENYESHKIRHGVDRARQGEESYVHHPIEAVAQKYSRQRNIPCGTSERILARPQERQLPLSPSETSTDMTAFRNYESHKTRHRVDRSRQGPENNVHMPIEAVAQKHSSNKNIPSETSERFLERPQERQLPLSPTEISTDRTAYKNNESPRIRLVEHRSRHEPERDVNPPKEAIVQKYSSQKNIPSGTRERILARPQERQLPLSPPEPTETSSDMAAYKNFESHKIENGVDRSRRREDRFVSQPIEAVAQKYSSQRNVPSDTNETFLARSQERQLQLSPSEPTETSTYRATYENYESHKIRQGVDRSRQGDESNFHRPKEAVAQKYSSQKNIPSRTRERISARPQENQLPLSPPEPTETPTDRTAYENYERHKTRHAVDRPRQGRERNVRRPIEDGSVYNRHGKPKTPTKPSTHENRVGVEYLDPPGPESHTDNIYHPNHLNPDKQSVTSKTYGKRDTATEYMAYSMPDDSMVVAPSGHVQSTEEKPMAKPSAEYNSFNDALATFVQHSESVEKIPRPSTTIPYIFYSQRPSTTVNAKRSFASSSVTGSHFSQSRQQESCVSIENTRTDTNQAEKHPVLQPSPPSSKTPLPPANSVLINYQSPATVSLPEKQDLTLSSSQPENLQSPSASTKSSPEGGPGKETPPTVRTPQLSLSRNMLSKQLQPNIEQTRNTPQSQESHVTSNDDVHVITTLSLQSLVPKPPLEKQPSPTLNLHALALKRSPNEKKSPEKVLLSQPATTQSHIRPTPPQMSHQRLSTRRSSPIRTVPIEISKPSNRSQLQTPEILPPFLKSDSSDRASSECTLTLGNRHPRQSRIQSFGNSNAVAAETADFGNLINEHKPIPVGVSNDKRSEPDISQTTDKRCEDSVDFITSESDFNPGQTSTPQQSTTEIPDGNNARSNSSVLYSMLKNRRDRIACSDHDMSKVYADESSSFRDESISPIRKSLSVDGTSSKLKVDEKSETDPHDESIGRVSSDLSEKIANAKDIRKDPDIDALLAEIRARRKSSSTLN